MITIEQNNEINCVPAYAALYLSQHPMRKRSDIAQLFGVSEPTAGRWRLALRRFGAWGGEIGETYYNKDEAARFLGVADTSLYLFIEKRGLPVTVFADGVEMIAHKALQRWSVTILPTVKRGTLPKEVTQ